VARYFMGSSEKLAGIRMNAVSSAWPSRPRGKCVITERESDERRQTQAGCSRGVRAIVDALRRGYQPAETGLPNAFIAGRWASTATRRHR